MKIVEPITGQTFTMPQLAKIYKVTVQTLHKRRAALWSDLGLLTGKKLPHLHALSVALHELPPPPPVGKKKILQPLELRPFKYAYDEWFPIEDDEEHYRETREQRATHYLAYRAEYDAVAAWFATVNAGLSIPAFPTLKYLKGLPPTPERMAALYKQKPPPPKPQAASYYYKDDPEDEFDAADCMPDPDEEY